MSSIAHLPPLPASGSSPEKAALPLDPRFVVSGATWELYDSLSDAIKEGGNIRLAFDGKDMEIMVLGPLHVGLKELIGWFIRELAVGLGLEHMGLGQTTWKRFELGRGLEADLCFYFDPDKLAIAQAALARESNDVRDYPNPDLAVEVDLSPSKIDRDRIYEALRVAEIWRFRGGLISIEQLAPDGSYVASDHSRFLRVRTEEINRWITSEDRTRLATWTSRLRNWIEADLRG